MNRILHNDITTRTLKDRIREMNAFQAYVSMITGKSLSEILSLKDGKEVVKGMFFSYLNQDGKIPKLAYMSKE